MGLTVGFGVLQIPQRIGHRKLKVEVAHRSSRLLGSTVLHTKGSDIPK